VNCQELGEQEIVEILRRGLEEFPLRAMGFFLPSWVEALDGDDPLKTALYTAIREAGEGAEKLRDRTQILEKLSENELISAARIVGEDLGLGTANAALELPRSLYYQLLSQHTGLSIQSDGDLMSAMTEMSAAKREYDRLRDALEQVRDTGYGVVLPSPEEMRLEEPQIVRQGGKYGVKLRAGAPAIHLLRTQVECEVNPAIGGDTASEDILGFLLQGFDGDVNRIWESNIFGKSLNELAEESLIARIESLPENAKLRLRETLQRLVNEDSSGLICILL
jgi:stage IV sporulation protein A